MKSVCVLGEEGARRGVCACPGVESALEDQVVEKAGGSCVCVDGFLTLAPCVP